MTGRRVNPRLTKLHRSYSPGEAARVLGVHKHTVHNWIKAGLPALDKSRPVLILGSEMRAWLEKRQKTAKRPCKPGTMYCFKCREPRPPSRRMVEYQPMTDKSGMLIAACIDCDTLMHRRARRDSIADSMPNLTVQIREAQPSIIGRKCPSLNCDKSKDS